MLGLIGGIMEIDSCFQKKLGNEKTFQFFMSIQGELYRSMNGRKTLRFYLGANGFFIKQHFGIGWKEVFKNLSQLKLPVIGAKTEYKAIRYLQTLDIETMDIVGFSQKGINPAATKSFLITKELDNTTSLEDYCMNWPDQSPSFREKQLLLKKVAKIVRKMHINGLNHRDLYICHFLLRKDTEEAEDNSHLFLIDLHKAQIRKIVPERWLIKDLSALYFSAMHIGLTHRDFLRFIKIYRGQSLRSLFSTELVFWDKVARKAALLDAMPESKKKT